MRINNSLFYPGNIKYNNPKWDLHMILDDTGSVIDYFITGSWKNK